MWRGEGRGLAKKRSWLKYQRLFKWSSLSLPLSLVYTSRGAEVFVPELSCVDNVDLTGPRAVSLYSSASLTCCLTHHTGELSQLGTRQSTFTNINFPELQILFLSVKSAKKNKTFILKSRSEPAWLNKSISIAKTDLWFIRYQVVQRSGPGSLSAVDPQSQQVSLH